jgi:protease IV
MEIQRESILISSIRSFCRMFFSVCGIFLSFFIITTLYSLAESAPMTIEPRTKIKYLSDVQGKRELAPITAPVILQININGVIGQPKGLDTSSIDQILTDSRSGTLRLDRVKGVLLYINSPGGSTIDSDNIYRLIKEYKTRYQVPVYAYIDGLCASGGMYIACSADKIYASPSSIIGSVGVISGPFFNVSEMLSKVGVASKTLTQGLDKDMMNPFRPWKENEDASLNSVMAYLYNRFVDVVTSNRLNMDKEKLVKEYGANIFDPEAARNYGYIDFANSNRSDALGSLLAAANIDPSQPYQVVSLEPKNEILAQLFDANSTLFSRKIEHKIDLGIPEFLGPFAYLYIPQPIDHSMNR